MPPLQMKQGSEVGHKVTETVHFHVDGRWSGAICGDLMIKSRAFSKVRKFNNGQAFETSLLVVRFSLNSADASISSTRRTSASNGQRHKCTEEQINLNSEVLSSISNEWSFSIMLLIVLLYSQFSGLIKISEAASTCERVRQWRYKDSEDIFYTPGKFIIHETFTCN